MSARWCGHCRSQQIMEWTADVTFGPGAESARCPACGAMWGVRERRRTSPFAHVAAAREVDKRVVASPELPP